MQKQPLTRTNVVVAPQFKFDPDSIIQTCAEISSRLALLFDLDMLVDATVSLIHKKLGYDQVTLQLLDSERRKFTLKIEASRKHPEVRQSYDFDNFASLAHRAARHKTVICIGDFAVETTPSYHPTAGLNIRSELHLPLWLGNDILGTLSLASEAPHTFSNPEVAAALKMLAAQVAIAIDRTTRAINPALN